MLMFALTQSGNAAAYRYSSGGRQLIHVNETLTYTEGLFVENFNKGLVLDYSAVAAKVLVTG